MIGQELDAPLIPSVKDGCSKDIQDTIMTKLYTKFRGLLAGMMTVIGSASMLLVMFTIYAAAASPTPDVKLNGMDKKITLTSDSTLYATIQLSAGDQLNEPADWWILAHTPVGWYAYQHPGMWHFCGIGMDQLVPAHQGPLFDLPKPVEVLRLKGLPVGAYGIYFGVDTIVNGRMDMESLFYDGVPFQVVAAPSFSVVDTGQTICYDDSGRIACPESGEAFYGQDAQYTGHTPGFIDNGDGTVTDTVTGLMWQKSPDLNGDGVINVNDKLTYDEALARAGMLRLGGYTDWRLPTIKELYSLIDFSGVDPSGDASVLIPFIDTDYFDFGYGDTSAGERIIDAQYASATQYVSTTMNGNETMFGVNFADGRIKGYPTGPMPGNSEGKGFYVLYVRGNTVYGENSFVDNGDGTVTDSATGLMWAQNDSSTGLNWKEALAWVQTKNAEDYLGYNDWRLPNAKELQSIVDYTRSPDTTGSAAIDPLFNATAITNEAGRTDYPFYWSSTTHASGSAFPGTYGAYVAFGRAMGYMNGAWIDVHGAGAQRSDPKSGDPADYPTGHGPQGDAIRIYNYVRMVRDTSGS